ncbi:response regulator [Gemmata sp.]|uniref:response regulator n=1 Tax=Gemmata sp. TaxID=1914242 RepID=UPI003F6F92A3
MLVVTRRPNEKIAFPSLGITVHVLRVTGASAKVGIEAPPEIKVLRDEIVPAAEVAAPARSPQSKRADHALANALSKVTLAVHLARKQWDAGRPAEADDTLKMALQALEALEPKAPAPPVPRRALIVEDDANERELLAGLLGFNGCECATAADGEDALAYLAAGNRPDVVIMDMAMPRCDGPETLRRIRADQRLAGLRVFSVSSTNPREVNVPDGPAGFDAWFPKPLNPKRLWDAIQDAVRSPATAN